MDIQTYSPQETKIVRINDLEKWGLNVPRMIYFPQNKKGYDRTKLNDFLEKHKKSGKFNIRTYTYSQEQEKEGWNSKHHVGLERDEIFKTMDKIISTCYSMVDAEIPSDGRYAGNIIIQDNDFCILEFFKGFGAMVRMADQTIQGNINNLYDDVVRMKHPELMKILLKIRHTNKPGKLFEWSILANPGGIKNEHLIFWEWRQFIPIRSADATLSADGEWRDFLS